MNDAGRGIVRKLGLRARGKLERRRRLREAALKVVLQRGYEGATTREIAARADVAIGTLFVYAAEKRDLLFLIFNDDLDELLESAVRSLSHDEPIMTQLIRLFRAPYEYFEDKVEIGRYGLGEIYFFQGEPKVNLGPEAARVFDRINRLLAILIDIFDRLKAAGRLTNVDSSENAAWALIWLHWGHIRMWLSQPRPKSRAALSGLRKLFAVAIGGLGPRPGEL